MILKSNDSTRKYDNQKLEGYIKIIDEIECKLEFHFRILRYKLDAHYICGCNKSIGKYIAYAMPQFKL